MSQPPTRSDLPPPKGPSSGRLVVAVFTTVALALLVSVSLGTWLAVERAKGRRPDVQASGPATNLVLVVFDSFRADRLGLDPGANAIAPATAALAARGVSAHLVWAPANRSDATLVSLLAGLAPLCHTGGPLPRGESLPELLRGQGYATAALVGLPQAGDLSGLAVHFDTYRAQGIMGRKLARLLGSAGAPPVGSTLLTQQAAHFLSENAHRPFFLYLHYADTRLPYGDARSEPRHRSFTGTAEEAARLRQALRQRPCDLSKEETARAAALYDDALTASDAQLSVVEGLLAERGLLEKTLLLVTGARGEALGERGCVGGGGTLFEEELRVPLLAAGAGVSAGRGIAASLSLLDLPPTLASIAGAKAPASWPGRNLSACLRGSGPCPTGPVVAAAFGDGSGPSQLAARGERFKLIRTLGEAPAERLYNLETDPGERSPLPNESGSGTAGLTTVLNTELARCGWEIP